MDQACRVALVATYMYRGTGVPKPADEPAGPNLWRYGGAAPSDIQPVEIVVESLACAP